MIGSVRTAVAIFGVMSILVVSSGCGKKDAKKAKVTKKKISDAEATKLCKNMWRMAVRAFLKKNWNGRADRLQLASVTSAFHKKCKEDPTAIKACLAKPETKKKSWDGIIECLKPVLDASVGTK